MKYRFMSEKQREGALLAMRDLISGQVRGAEVGELDELMKKYGIWAHWSRGRGNW